MKAPYTLLTDARLAFIAKNHTVHVKEFVAMALELLEYRMSYGELGCKQLDAESESFTKMKG